MSHEESILDFMQQSPESSYARKEIARKAIGRAEYEENERWADQPLASLVSLRLIEIDNSGHYRLHQGGKHKTH